MAVTNFLSAGYANLNATNYKLLNACKLRKIGGILYQNTCTDWNKKCSFSSIKKGLGRQRPEPKGQKLKIKGLIKILNPQQLLQIYKF